MAKKKESKIEKPQEDLRIQENRPKFKEVLSGLVNRPSKPKE